MDLPIFDCYKMHKTPGGSLLIRTLVNYAFRLMHISILTAVEIKIHKIIKSNVVMHKATCH